MKTEQEVDKLSGTEVEDEKPQSKAKAYLNQARLKLKPGLNFVLDGFPPVIAVIALIVAVFAMSESRSLRAQLNTAVAKLESLNLNKGIPSKEEVDKVKASVEGIDKAKASIDDLDKVKALMAQEKEMREAEASKQSERVTKIIQGVSKLQVKMKISPTLETQMREPVTVPLASHAPAPAPAPIPAKELILSKPEVSAPVKSMTKAEVPASKTPVTAVSTDSKKQREAQVKTIKEQIEEFNRK
jgi:hypothetical protein